MENTGTDSFRLYIAVNSVPKDENALLTFNTWTSADFLSGSQDVSEKPFTVYVSVTSGSYQPVTNLKVTGQLRSQGSTATSSASSTSMDFVDDGLGGNSSSLEL